MECRTSWQKIARLLSLLGLISGLTIAGAAASHAGTLSLSVYTQEKSNWCWAASSKTIIQWYKGSSPSQCTLVKSGQNSTSCANNNTGSFVTQLNRIYADNGLTGGTIVNTMPSLLTIQYDVDRYNPLHIRYGYHSSSLSTGHMVAIRGYSGSTIYWTDPASGTNKSGSWSYLANNSTWETTHGRFSMGG